MAQQLKIRSVIEARDIQGQVAVGRDQRGIAFFVSIGTISDLNLGKFLLNCDFETKWWRLLDARMDVISM